MKPQRQHDTEVQNNNKSKLSPSLPKSDRWSSPSSSDNMFRPEDLTMLLSINADHHSQFQRGPKYAAYSKLRESKLLFRKLEQQRMDAGAEMDPILSPAPTPRAKNKTAKRKLVSSPLLTSSVPNLPSVLRKEKENRRPVAVPVPFRSGSGMSSKASPLPPKAPPMKTPSPTLGSKSAAAARTMRRSFSCLKETKGSEDAGRNGLRNGNLSRKMAGAAESTGAAGFRRYGN